MINADPRPVAVLPADSMREFGWAGTAPVLDPLPRWVSADVLTTGDLVIGGHDGAGRGRRARATCSGCCCRVPTSTSLADAGVGWVVVESGKGSIPLAPLRLPVAYRDEALTLYRVGGDHSAAEHRGELIAVHLVWLATLGVGAVGMFVGTARSRRERADAPSA